MKEVITLLVLILTFGPAALGEDATFTKSRFSSVKQPREADVIPTITSSKILIKNKVNKKQDRIDVVIPYSSIASISYEVATRHRTGEGALLMDASLGAGAVLMASKTKSYWMDIEYHDDKGARTTTLRLDKTEYERVIKILEFRTGKHIAKLDSKTRPHNPIAGSVDVNKVVPFRMESVVAALKPAMDSIGCNVTDVTPNQVVCKRRRGQSERTGPGGEKITATLEAQGKQTIVRIATGKGTQGRMERKNWSTPTYNEMVKNLQVAVPLGQIPLPPSRIVTATRTH